MSNCPWCGTVYNSTYPPVDLSSRQRKIYDAILESGPKGVKKERLLETVFGAPHPDSAPGVLRVNIFEINRKIRSMGHRIKGRRDIGYVLTHSE